VYAPFVDFADNVKLDTVQYPDEDYRDYVINYVENLQIGIDAELKKSAIYTQDMDSMHAEYVAKALHKIYTEAGWYVCVELNEDSQFHKTHHEIHIQRPRNTAS
jgi:hypothetical protein